MENKQASVFHLGVQAVSLDAKIVVALERIAEVFRVSLWEIGKKYGLSPLQIQLLIFLQFHSSDKCKVSYLAQEFNLSKPTISESVRTMLKKELIQKETDPTDTRSYTINLTEKGQKLATEVSFFANDLQQAFENWNENRKSQFYYNILEVITKLQKLGLINIQRTCHHCRYLQKNKDGHFCSMLKMPLQTQAFRVDCPEFKEA